MQGEGDEHGARIIKRDHYRRVHDTPEVPNENEIIVAETLFHSFEKHGAFLDRAEE
jgi:hypothetical protein